MTACIRSERRPACSLSIRLSQATSRKTRRSEPPGSRRTVAPRQASVDPTSLQHRASRRPLRHLPLSALSTRVSPVLEIAHAELRAVRGRVAGGLSLAARGTAALAGVACVLGLLGVRGPVDTLLPFTLIAAPALAALAAVLRQLSLSTKGPLTVDEHTLRIGRRTIARADIVEGFAIARRGGCEVELTLSSHSRVAVRLRRAVEGEQLLEALGLGPARRRFTVRWAHAMTSFLWWSGVFAAAELIVIRASSSVHDGAGYMFAALYFVVPFVAAYAARLLATREVTVGADGIRHGWRWFHRFVPFASIARVDILPSYIRLRGGGARDVFVRADPEDTSLARALYDAIERAREGAAPPAPPLPVRREGRSVSSWRAALADQLRGAHGYRGV